jgi:hypothetical protein
VPASWAGLGDLLTGAGERAPADALTLAAIASGQKVTAPTVDLWASGRCPRTWLPRAALT